MNSNLQPWTSVICRANGLLFGLFLFTCIQPAYAAGNALTFKVGRTNGPAGAQVVVPVKASQFTNISTFQFSLHWQTACAVFVAVEQFGVAGLSEGNFGTNFSANGTLTVSWDDPSGHSTTMPDGSTLFGVRLQLVGPAGTNSAVWIDGTPTPIEAADEGLNAIAVVTNPGQVLIDLPPVHPLILPLGSTNGQPGSQVLLAVHASQFSNISALQFSFHWSASQGSFMGVEQFGLPGLAEGNFGTNFAANGTLTFSWDDPNGLSTSLADGTILFCVRVTLKGTPGATNIWIDGNPTNMEAGNAQSQPVPITVISGVLTVDPPQIPPAITSQPAGQTICLGEDLLLCVTATGSLPISYQWRLNGSPLPDAERIIGSRSNCLAIYAVRSTDAGSYSVVVTNAYGAATSAPPAVLTLNTAPTLEPIDNQVIAEGNMLTFIASGHDNDSPAQALSYTLGAGSPAGAGIDPATGVFTWTPAEAQGPGTYPIAVIVHDNCAPSLSATQWVTVTVLETNNPPIITPIPTQMAYVLKVLRITNIVFDPDPVPNRVTFQLGAGAPARSRLDAKTGVFAFMPDRSQARTTNWIDFIAVDDGQPPKRATNTVCIIVDDYAELTMGQAVARTNTSGSVLVNLSASCAIHSMSASLIASNHWLTSLALNNLAAEVQSAALVAQSPDVWQLSFTAAPGAALPTGTLGELFFTAVPNPSAFVPLLVSDVMAVRREGGSLSRTLAGSGRVAVVGYEPMLESLVDTNHQKILLLYSQPGGNYLLHSTTALGPMSGWQQFSPGSVSNLVQVVQPEALTNGVIFFRGQR